MNMALSAADCIGKIFDTSISFISCYNSKIKDENGGGDL